MDRILGISDSSAAALHALAIAAAGDGKVTVADAAERLGVSRSYLAKVLQALARKGLVRSTRGAAGGYELAKLADELSSLEIVVALEGPLPERDCLFKNQACGRGSCALRALCRKVAESTRRALETTSVAALAAGFK